MSQTTNRTFICSVVFLDIVAYSQLPVDEQIKLKNQFNIILAEAIKDVAVNDRIILDTGDGAAISFLGDPEDALFVALNIRDAIVGEKMYVYAPSFCPYRHQSGAGQTCPGYQWAAQPDRRWH